MQIRAFGYDNSLDTSQPVHENLSLFPMESRIGGLHPQHHELLYIIEGTLKITINNVTYRMTGPAVLLIPLNTSHHLQFLSLKYRYAYWELQDDAYESFPVPADCEAWNRLQTEPDGSLPAVRLVYERIHALHQVLIAEWMRKQPDLARQISYSDIQAILAIIRSVARPDTNRYGKSSQLPDNRIASTLETIEILVRWMESSYWENFTLQKLCEYAHLNPSYMVRTFKACKGVSPLQFLNNLRMSAAEKHLLESMMSVQDIAHATGFQSIHYFSRLFKQKFGKSPAHWRSEHKKTTSVSD
ncbi:AraC family transcriptional regulator [Cohnella rhizosphaerae]|uniref:AraC family transcriptional regulator n=1 Tax=Cohnella rhizosphaerae TaxID=1457232 RepID=A0A9X4L6B0_9BACL|nr:AraC family transcriptional regulator [Cohnella rhizosphaerae]MDG0814704.1 AraC family transcriptional regulator [Cohnella rhizosphaerae]